MSTFTDLTALKSHVHGQLLKRLDLTVMERLEIDELRTELGDLVKMIVNDEQIKLSADDLTALVQAIQNEVMGLGPIEPLMADPTVSDILVTMPGSHTVHAPSAALISSSASNKKWAAFSHHARHCASPI